LRLIFQQQKQLCVGKPFKETQAGLRVFRRGIHVGMRFVD